MPQLLYHVNFTYHKHFLDTSGGENRDEIWTAKTLARRLDGVEAFSFTIHYVQSVIATDEQVEQAKRIEKESEIK